MAAVVPEDHAEAEPARQRPERANEPSRVRARTAVGDEAGRPVPHDLRVERRPVDPELHAPGAYRPVSFTAFIDW